MDCVLLVDPMLTVLHQEIHGEVMEAKYVESSGINAEYGRKQKLYWVVGRRKSGDVPSTEGYPTHKTEKGRKRSMLSKRRFNTGFQAQVSGDFTEVNWLRATISQLEQQVSIATSNPESSCPTSTTMNGGLLYYK
eukprot:TRINITY_DN622_c0_g1_i12.p1 TRINITY_DN622_c0_g1~~TRINITY_DN622_c0_g1_i12.p1  ORF type:complete len:135 (+),score=28.65 TRINITY_DN622_c0_g1_i12:51-455(+)